jgi:hypothetical protein
MPLIPATSLLIEDVLTGKVRPTELSQVFVNALFKGDSDQALRPSDPTTLFAYAEAAQYGMRAGAPATTEANNRKGWALWTEFIREFDGNPQPLRRPDPDHFLRECLLKMSGALLFFIIDGEVKRSPKASELKSMRRGRDRIGVLAFAAKTAHC